MIDKYYEDIYNKIEHEIKKFFIPRSIEKNEFVKAICKEFSSGERKSCTGVFCVECPFSNKLERGCLQSIITSLLRKDSSFNFKVRLPFSYRKAGEYYLKHYCIEYKQEEMDV